MKLIYRIAKAELRMLFCSPVAWFLLVIFTLQTALFFTGRYEWFMKGYDGAAGKAARIGKQGIVRDIPGDILYPHGGIVVESESVPIFIDAFVDDGVD